MLTLLSHRRRHACAGLALLCRTASPQATLLTNPNRTQDHFSDKYNRATLDQLSAKYRSEAAQHEFGSAVLRFAVDQYCPFLKSQYLFLVGVPRKPNIFDDQACVSGGELTIEERALAFGPEEGEPVSLRKAYEALRDEDQRFRAVSAASVPTQYNHHLHLDTDVDVEPGPTHGGGGTSPPPPARSRRTSLASSFGFVIGEGEEGGDGGAGARRPLNASTVPHEQDQGPVHATLHPRQSATQVHTTQSLLPHGLSATAMRLLKDMVG